MLLLGIAVQPHADAQGPSFADFFVSLLLSDPMQILFLFLFAIGAPVIAAGALWNRIKLYKSLKPAIHLKAKSIGLIVVFFVMSVLCLLYVFYIKSQWSWSYTNFG